MPDAFQIIKATVGLPVSDKTSALMGKLVKRPTVYGWHVDPTEPDPEKAVTYLASARGKTPARMGAGSFNYGSWKRAFFMPRPCMLRYDGTVAYYLDPDDYTKKADGTPSDVGNAAFEGNAMMEWPLIWYKFEAGEADGEGYFYCSDKQIDSSYKCWCNIDSQNNIIPHFYTAIYNGCIVNSKMRSLSGISLDPDHGYGNTTGQQEINAALANGLTSAVDWYTDVFSDRMLISALLILISKTLNNKAAFGRGMDSSGTSSHRDRYTTGALNGKGQFWGSTSVGTQGVKVFGMEGWYACRYRRLAGLLSVTDNDTRRYAYKLTYGTADGSSASAYNEQGSGYLTTEFAIPYAATTTAVRKMTFGRHGMLPSEVGSSATTSTYFAVAFYYGTGNAITSANTSNAEGSAGSMYFGFGTAFTDKHENVGTSLSCKPVKTAAIAV